LTLESFKKLYKRKALTSSLHFCDLSIFLTLQFLIFFNSINSSLKNQLRAYAPQLSKKGNKDVLMSDVNISLDATICDFKLTPLPNASPQIIQRELSSFC